MNFNITKLILIGFIASTTAACVVEPADRTVIRTRDVRVDVDRDRDYYQDDRSHRRGYYHCPPGHAKKGWC